MPLATPDVDLDLVLDEEIEKLPPCESANHPKGNVGHVPGTSAEYWIIPSCGHEWYACAGWTHRAMGLFGFYICPDGGKNHKADILNILPLK